MPFSNIHIHFPATPPPSTTDLSPASILLSFIPMNFVIAKKKTLHSQKLPNLSERTFFT